MLLRRDFLFLRLTSAAGEWYNEGIRQAFACHRKDVIVMKSCNSIRATRLYVKRSQNEHNPVHKVGRNQR